MANTTLSAATFTSLLPRANHIGTNNMAATYTDALTASASMVYQMFNIPPNCVVVSGGIQAGWAAGVSSQWIIKLGVPGNDAVFGTFTASNSVEINTALGATNANPQGWFTPFTLSSSGTDAIVPVIVTMNTAPSSATVSFSVYVKLEYVMPNNI